MGAAHRYGTLLGDGTWLLMYQQFDYGWNNTLCAQIRNLDLNITHAHRHFTVGATRSFQRKQR